MPSSFIANSHLTFQYLAEHWLLAPPNQRQHYYRLHLLHHSEKSQTEDRVEAGNEHDCPQLLQSGVEICTGKKTKQYQQKPSTRTGARRRTMPTLHGIWLAGCYNSTTPGMSSPVGTHSYNRGMWIKSYLCQSSNSKGSLCYSGISWLLWTRNAIRKGTHPCIQGSSLNDLNWRSRKKKNDTVYSC